MGARQGSLVTTYDHLSDIVQTHNATVTLRSCNLQAHPLSWTSSSWCWWEVLEGANPTLIDPFYQQLIAAGHIVVDVQWAATFGMGLHQGN